MKPTSTAKHQHGGAVVWFVVAAVLVLAAYAGYRLLVFYRDNVAPTVSITAPAAAINGWLSR